MQNRFSRFFYQHFLTSKSINIRICRSAFTKLSLETGHIFDFSIVHVRTQANNFHKMCVEEIMHLKLINQIGNTENTTVHEETLSKYEIFQLFFEHLIRWVDLH